MAKDEKLLTSKVVSVPPNGLEKSIDKIYELKQFEDIKVIFYFVLN